MTEFQELIKNFERIRDYMRQFYVYGYKVRNDFDDKSARTYDNERRRIESWMSGYIRSDYTAKGKQVAISVNSRQITQNPLYAAWKSKSFTDNDIMLHFLLLDLLWDGAKYSAAKAADHIADCYGIVFDQQTVRLKLKEYETLGILCSEKSGRRLHYFLSSVSTIESSPLYGELITAVKFFQEAAPFGFIGSTLLDREAAANEFFSFKHHFIVHTLEDQVLLDILSAMREQQKIKFENTSVRTGQTTQMTGIPLKIFVSTQTGRRYACIYHESNRRFRNMRLDSMRNIISLDTVDHYAKLKKLLNKNLPYCWGVSFGSTSRLEDIHLKLHIDEQKEPYIIERLRREGRGGEVLRVAENTFLYSGTYFDTNEMLGWVKTFTGRILDIQGSNRDVIDKLERDLNRMYAMYCE